MPCTSASQAQLLAALTERVRKLEGWRRPKSDQLLSSGCAALDRLLPEGGLRRAALVECLAAAPGSGAALLAFVLARQAAAAGGAVVVLDEDQLFYPPAAAALGIALEQVIVLRPTRAADHAWGLDQALRCPAVAAVVCWPSKWGDHTYRRLQLAAKAGETLGLLVRTAAAGAAPSWADVRLGVSALPSDVHDAAAVKRRLKVELLRVRGGAAGGNALIELDEQTGMLSEAINHETRNVHLAASLAPAALGRRSSGA